MVPPANSTAVWGLSIRVDIRDYTPNFSPTSGSSDPRVPCLVVFRCEPQPLRLKQAPCKVPPRNGPLQPLGRRQVPLFGDLKGKGEGPTEEWRELITKTGGPIYTYIYISIYLTLKTTLRTSKNSDFAIFDPTIMSLNRTVKRFDCKHVA